MDALGENHTPAAQGQSANRLRRLLVGAISIAVGVSAGGLSGVSFLAAAKAVTEDAGATTLYQLIGVGLAGALATAAAFGAWTLWVKLPSDSANMGEKPLTVGELRSLLARYPNQALVYAGCATQKRGVHHALQIEGEMVRSLIDFLEPRGTPPQSILLLITNEPAVEPADRACRHRNEPEA